MALESSLLGKEQPLDGERLLPAWRVLFVLCVVAFTSNVIISLIAPILPQHFEAIGVSQVWCGVMFSGFPVATLVFSPLVVVAMAKCGRAPVLFVGLLLQGVTSITFGFADRLTGGAGVNREAALAVYTVSRLACGAGAACANNAIFSVAADRFPTSLAKVMGLNEVVIGAGFSLGPPIGTALMMRFGFAYSFVASGLALLLFAPCALLIWQPRPAKRDGAGEADEAAGGLCEVLTPELVIAGGCLLLGTGVFGIVEPILSLYLRDEVGVGQAAIGLIFAAFSVAYSVAGPLMGVIADRLGSLRVCAAGGLSGGLVMALLLGPEAGLFPTGSPARVAYEVAALMLLGTAQAATLIPSLPAMKAGAPSGAASVTDRVVAWFNMFLQLGLALGPIAGTALSEAFGFEIAMLSCGTFIAAYGLMATYFAKKKAQSQPRAGRVSSHLITGVSVSPYASPKVSVALTA